MNSQLAIRDESAVANRPSTVARVRMPRRITRAASRLAAVAVAAAVLTTGFTAPEPAAAFDSASSVRKGGVTYRVSAYSCNFYLRACSWHAKAAASKKRKFTHRADVKANGVKLRIRVSAPPSVTITGNSTKLASAKKKVNGKKHTIKGVAYPSIFTVSVASRSRLIRSNVSLNSGWTTW